MITILSMGKWIRCLTTETPKRCIAIDTGEPIKISLNHERDGIFQLELCFFKLPPRVILCGLGNIIPSSVRGARWSKGACKMFKHVTEGRLLSGQFIKHGSPPNTFYIFLTSIAKNNVVVHVNTLLVAFNEAMTDFTGLHHPIWPEDKCR